ncbi:MAG: ParA family protein [Magnetococcales bacterium]|nr:ParA family protein [Magnetococcales bacterium]
MAKSVAVINRKGGVGKTTCAVNIAVCLAAAGQNVLLLDMDPQGNATTHMGIRKEKGMGTVYHLLTGQKNVSQVLRTIYSPALHFIMADSHLVGAEIELVDYKEREKKLSRALEAHAADFDYILIDCPPSLGLLTLNALVAADGVIIPLQCEFFSMEGFMQTRDTIDRINRNFDKSITMDAVLFNMVDGSPEKNAFIQEFRERLLEDSPVATWTIPYDNQINIAPSHLKPGVCFNPWGHAAKQFQEIALNLIWANRGSV